jgi:hypothetical protein
MSANLAAHSVKGGFNQSGGSMFMVLADLEPVVGTAKYVYTISVASSNSGGATTAPTFLGAKMSDVLKAGATYSALSDIDGAGFVAKGSLIEDMGKSVVGVNGRTYRKFAVAATGAQFVSSFGIAGNGAAAPNTGYGSFYLEVGRDGFADSTNGPAPIVRYC